MKTSLFIKMKKFTIATHSFERKRKIMNVPLNQMISSPWNIQLQEISTLIC